MKRCRLKLNAQLTVANSTSITQVPLLQKRKKITVLVRSCLPSPTNSPRESYSYGGGQDSFLKLSTAESAK